MSAASLEKFVKNGSLNYWALNEAQRTEMAWYLDLWVPLMAPRMGRDATTQERLDEILSVIEIVLRVEIEDISDTLGQPVVFDPATRAAVKKHLLGGIADFLEITLPRSKRGARLE